MGIHLPAGASNGLFVEIFPDPNRDPMWFDLPVQQPEVRDGCMEVPPEPGLGIDLRPEVITKYTAKSAV